jgi:hypothetical protein
MVGSIDFGGGGLDYVGPTSPTNPQAGESWYDTDANDGAGEVKVYDGSSWNVTGFVSHGDLMDVGPANHHSPVSVTAPLTEDGSQGLGLSLGTGLSVLDGRLGVPVGSLDASRFAFDPVSQPDLSEHANDSSNPHNVTADQADAAPKDHNHDGRYLKALTRETFKIDGSTSSVSFNNTYDSDQFIVTAQTIASYDYESSSVVVDTYQRDRNGNVTGVALSYDVTSGKQAKTRVSVLGVTV